MGGNVKGAGMDFFFWLWRMGNKARELGNCWIGWDRMGWERDYNNLHSFVPKNNRYLNYQHSELM